MKYATVGLIGKPEHEGTHVSLTALTHYLHAKGCRVLIESRLHEEMDDDRLTSAELVTIGQEADLAIVVGGDGNMLGAARVLSRFDIHVVGVNRGNLGFLTDINPDDINTDLDAIFSGEGIIEQRFLLEVDVFRHESLKSTNVAVNEVVLHHGKVAHMMEFEVDVNGKFMFSQRSDGLIVATPTGSTAYSLSCGGPIIFPRSGNFVITPVAPHNLNVRPVVISDNSVVSFEIEGRGENFICTLDSRFEIIKSHYQLAVRKNDFTINLVRLEDVSFLRTIREKLTWGKDIRN